MRMEQELYEQIEKITCTDYEGIIDKNGYDFIVTIESAKNMIQDLIFEIKRLEEEKEDILQDRQENYRPIPVEEQI